MNTDPKMLYIKDPDCPDRVVTIARKVTEDGKLWASYAMNRVDTFCKREKLETEDGAPVWVETKGTCIYDPFTKRVGRRIAKSRLAAPQDERHQRFVYEIPVADGQRNRDAVLQFFQTSPSVPIAVRHVIARGVWAASKAQPVTPRFGRFSKPRPAKFGDRANTLKLPYTGPEPAKLDDPLDYVPAGLGGCEG